MSQTKKEKLYRLWFANTEESYISLGFWFREKCQGRSCRSSLREWVKISQVKKAQVGVLERERKHKPQLEVGNREEHWELQGFHLHCSIGCERERRIGVGEAGGQQQQQQKKHGFLSKGCFLS